MTTPSVDGDTLLARLNALFTEDPDIDEIGLLFGIEADELTPDVAFQLAEHKLGVAFSAGPLVFRAARTRFHALNAKLHAGEITHHDCDTANDLLASARAVLLISADFYTAWNTRKEFVRRGWLSPSREVAFTSLVFSLHPKSIDTWAYRRWLATRLLVQLTPSEAVDFFDAQVALCGVLAERFPRNYHAWSFRHWIVSQFEDTLQLKRELQAMQTWCETHLMDHSGWNHRQHTIKCLLQKSQRHDHHASAGFELLVQEYAFLSNILAKYPKYEALWCHRRFVMQTLLAEAASVDTSGSDVQAAVDEVASILQGSKTVGENEEWLQSQFTLVHATLLVPASVPASALRDVAIAWQCGNRFARRYAAWLVERLHGAMRPQANSLKRLNQLMRASLTSEDALLGCLWQATRSTV